MSLAANAQKKEVVGDEETFPVAAAAHPYQNSMCVLDNDGNAAALTAGGGKFIGHAVAEADNSSGAAAALNVTVKAGRYRRQVTLSSVAKGDEGRAVYASDDATLTLQPSSGATYYPVVGVVYRYVTTDTAIVEFRTHEWLEEGARGLPGLARFFDDFLGNAQSALWDVVDVNDATEAPVAASHMGEFALGIAATSEAEDAVLYFGDALNFDIDKLQYFRARVKFALPGSGVKAVVGMASAHDLDKDTIAASAWLSLDAALAAKAESDDGVNNNDDKTAQTLVAGTYYLLEIDFRDTADVKFYIDGTQVATGTTFDMSNYTAGLQPYASLDKASGTGTGTITLDFVEIVCER